MQRIGTYILVALIALAIGAFASSKWFTTKPEVVIKTEYDTIIEEKVDSTKIKYLEELLAEKSLKVETVTVKIPVPVTEEESDSTFVTTKRYKGVANLDNGTIKYEIYADSLHGVKFTLATQDTVINTTKTITKLLPSKSALFIGGGVDYNGSISSVEAGLMYNRKQKWQAGIVVNHDLTGLLPSQARTSVGVRAYFKL